MKTILQQAYNRHMRGIDRTVWEYMPILRHTTIMTNAQQVVELGVREGQSTSAFLLGLLETGGRLWSCDLDYPLPSINHLIGKVPFWQFQQGDSRSLIDQAPSGVDILFIDTEHTYAQCSWELDHYSKLVRSGGHIILHDTNLPAIDQAIQGILSVHKDWWYINDPAIHGLGFIRCV